MSERRFDCIAIDAPLVPENLPIAGRRTPEVGLSLGSFQRRCKPGRSDIRGIGRQLRAAGGRAADRLAPLLGAGSQATPRVRGERGLAEAFPNAFLGVCLPDEVFASRPRIPRGRKFDWLYDRWLDRNLFERWSRHLDLPSGFSPIAFACRDHEKRAALVCLMTAAALATGRYSAVGAGGDGYFFLPSLGEWQPWARAALDESSRRVRNLEVVSGSRS